MTATMSLKRTSPWLLKAHDRDLEIKRRRRRVTSINKLMARAQLMLTKAMAVPTPKSLK